MSLEITWSDEVRRFHEFGPEEVARASTESSFPEVSWPAERDLQRAPFDLDAAIARWDAFLAKHGAIPNDWSARNAATDALKTIGEDLRTTRGRLGVLEANFWFHVLTSPDLFDELGNTDRNTFDRSAWLDPAAPFYDADTALARLAAFGAARRNASGFWSGHAFDKIGWFLDVMLDPEDAVRIVCASFGHREVAQYLCHIRPYPHDHPTTSARVGALEQHYRLSADSRFDRYDQESVARLLALIPSTTIAQTAVAAAVTNGQYSYALPLWLHIQLVDDHDLSVKTMGKMGYKLSTYEEQNASAAPARLIALFLALGYEGLPALVKLAANQHNKQWLPNLLKHVCRIHAPEMAKALAQIDGKAEAQNIERDYLRREGANAVSGLLALSGRRGKKRDLALDVLGHYIKNGHRELVERLLDDAPKAGAKVVREELLSKTAEDASPADLEAAMDELPEELRAMAALPTDVAFPEGLDPSRLPPLILVESGKRVPDAVTERAVATIFLSHTSTKDITLDKKTAEARRVKALAAIETFRGLVTPESASALWQHLFDQALIARSRWTPGNDVIMSVIELGSEAEYQRLEIGMRNRSSGFSDHSARVAMGALIKTGERSAWAALLEASVRIRDQGLRKSAHNYLEGLRTERGWTLGELHDRLVPDCRLDDHGTRVFDYGSRQFELVFQGAFDIAITDSDGKRYTRLPPARKADDRDLVKAAKADFKITKEQIKLVVETQTRRLEEDLLTARRWTARAWREDVLAHPLMRHFARTLVWGRYDHEGKLLSTFVPNIDGGCMDTEFDEVELPDDALVSIVHPLELDDHAIHEWETVLADFELQQPFDQLHRATYPRETWGEHLPWIGTHAGHWQMYEGLKKTRRWDGLIKRTKSSKRKFGARDLGDSGFKVRLCFHKGAWTLRSGEEQPPDGLYFFTAKSQPKPSDVVDPETGLPERVVSEIIREVLQAYASEAR